MDKYIDIDFLKPEKNILLTKDKDTGIIYVKKYLSDAQSRIYTHLKDNSYKGIPHVADIYHKHGCYVLIEEYIHGQTLQQLLDSGKSFTAAETEYIAECLCRTLSPLHKAGIIHRDITASNVMITTDKRVYLIDFGNARIFKKGKSTDTEFIGTQNYAAPEQFGFGQSDIRTDIFAIGQLMNVLLTGGSYTGELPVKGALGRIIKKCTAVKPSDRYKNTSRLGLAIFRARHRVLFGKPMLCVYALLIPAVIYIAHTIAVTPSASVNERYLLVEQLEPSTPAEKNQHIWQHIEDAIADGDYEKAEQLLDAAAPLTVSTDTLNQVNVMTWYHLYSQLYSARGDYNKAAEIVLEYINGRSGTGTPTASFKRLWYLYPDCTDENIKAQIEKLPK